MLTTRSSCRRLASRSFSIAAPAFPDITIRSSEDKPKSTKARTKEASIKDEGTVLCRTTERHSKSKGSPWSSIIDHEVLDGTGMNNLPTRTYRPSLGVSPGFFTTRSTGFFTRRNLNRRGYATGAGAGGSSDRVDRPLADSDLFKDWDSLMENLPPPTLSPIRSVRDGPGSLPPRPLDRPRARRQTMTAKEMASFEDMFQIIFNAMSEDKRQSEERRMEARDRKAAVPIERKAAIPIVKSKGKMDDLYTRLKQHSRKLTGEDEMDDKLGDLLDRAREDMANCTSDEELLRWGMRTVFPHVTSEKTSPAYPHILATLMRTFREKYEDPHLALAVFNFARHLSVTSYAYGCTTPAYNELLKTRWNGFKDLKTVVDGLEEMNVNGVPVDETTRRIVEGVRAEIGAASGDEARRLLTRMDALIRRSNAFDEDDGSLRKDRAQSQWSRRRGRRLSEWKFNPEAETALTGDAGDKLEMDTLWEEAQERQEKGYGIGQKSLWKRDDEMRGQGGPMEEDWEEDRLTLRAEEELPQRARADFSDRSERNEFQRSQPKLDERDLEEPDYDEFDADFDSSRPSPRKFSLTRGGENLRSQPRVPKSAQARHDDFSLADPEPDAFVFKVPEPRAQEEVAQSRHEEPSLDGPEPDEFEFRLPEPQAKEMTRSLEELSLEGPVPDLFEFRRPESKEKDLRIPQLEESDIEFKLPAPTAKYMNSRDADRPAL